MLKKRIILIIFIAIAALINYFLLSKAFDITKKDEYLFTVFYSITISIIFAIIILRKKS